MIAQQIEYAQYVSPTIQAMDEIRARRLTNTRRFNALLAHPDVPKIGFAENWAGNNLVRYPGLVESSRIQQLCYSFDAQLMVAMLIVPNYKSGTLVIYEEPLPTVVDAEEIPDYVQLLTCEALDPTVGKAPGSVTRVSLTQCEEVSQVLASLCRYRCIP